MLYTFDNKKLLICLSIICILFAQLMIPIKVLADGTIASTVTTDAIRANVIEVVSTVKNNIPTATGTAVTETQNLKVEILKGKHIGQTVVIQNVIDNSKQNTYKLAKGDDVFLSISEDANGTITEANIYQIARDNQLLYLLGAFALSMILIGGSKGIKSIFTLAFTVIMVLKVFLTYTLKGYDPITLSIIICIAISIVTLTVVGGLNRKTLSAIIGTSSGVIIAGVISFIMVNSTKVNGVGTQEAQLLMDAPLKNPINFKSLLFAAILIGTLGAVMDISMSIASTMKEIKEANPRISIGEFIRSGMSVGRDVMGTMANTLILAYMSGAICLILGFMANNSLFVDIINQDMIACEIIKTLTGSIGLIFTIPITVLVSSIFL